MATRPGPKALTNGERYVRAMQATRRFVAGIRGNQWRNPTPCAEWDVRTVVNHITGEALWAVELLAGRTIAQVGSRLDGDVLGSAPLKAFDAAVSAASEAMRAPGAMKAVCHLSYGDTPGTQYAREMTLDALVHGWDIAKGSGQNTRLNATLVGWLYRQYRPEAKGLTASGAFGTPQKVAANAGTQTRLLAMLGRRATWPK